MGAVRRTFCLANMRKMLHFFHDWYICDPRPKTIQWRRHCLFSESVRIMCSHHTWRRCGIRRIQITASLKMLRSGTEPSCGHIQFYKLACKRFDPCCDKHLKINRRTSSVSTCLYNDRCYIFGRQSVMNTLQMTRMKCSQVYKCLAIVFAIGYLTTTFEKLSNL